VKYLRHIGENFGKQDVFARLDFNFSGSILSPSYLLKSPSFYAIMKEIKRK